MTDQVNKEIKIAVINETDSNTKETKNNNKNIERSLIKQIKADGYLTHPSKTTVKSYSYNSNNVDDELDVVAHEVQSIILAIENNSNIIISSDNNYYFHDKRDYYFHDKKEKYLLSEAFSRLISHHGKEALLFFNFGNNKNGLLDNNAHNYYKVNNHRTIPVGSIYYKKDFEQNSQNPKDKVKLTSPPGANVFISDRTPYAVFHVAGSAGAIAYRHLKPRTQGDFPMLTKKYLGYSARRINQNKLRDGWATKEASYLARHLKSNEVKDCNFGLGLELSYEHGTGEYDPIAFSNLCQSHLPEFDIQRLTKSKPHQNFMKLISHKEKVNRIIFRFQCDGHKGYIDGVYFAFQGLEEANIKTISLISPLKGTRSNFVNKHTSLRASIMDNKPSNEKILYLKENTGHSYESNRHFGEKVKKGQWKAIVDTYDLVSLSERVYSSLEFKLFDQKNRNMIVNNNIFHSDETQFTYKNDKNELDYFNLSPTSSENVVNLQERKATLTYTHPHPKIRTTDDLEAYEKSLQEPVTPKVVNVTIDPDTTVEYIADGSGDGTLIGNEAKNKLLGLGGDDTLHGEGGNDDLYPGRANKLDKGYGGTGHDTHHVYSYEPGHYEVDDDKAGNNSIVFYVSYKENVKRSVNKATKEIAYKVNYIPLTLDNDNVKFSKNGDTTYGIQVGNKTVRFDSTEIKSVVLKHELTGETKSYGRKSIDLLCSR